MRKSARILGATLCLACGSGVAHAITVPGFIGTGVPPPGYPDFWGANVDATLTRNKNGSFTLSVLGNTAACGSSKTLANCSAALFNFPAGAYLVGNETLNLTANFSSGGMFTSGSYTITGSLPASSNPTLGMAPPNVGWGAQGNETLLTATLTGDAIDSTDAALGFAATITGGWADQKQFTSGSPESVWLYSLVSGLSMTSGDSTANKAWNNFLAELQSGHLTKGASFVAIGSIATVPLPGVVMLFGSGVMGLLGLARRRRLSLAS